MSLFVILLGGELVRTPLVDQQITGGRFIAADSGIRHAGILGITPELWIGDFDSVPAAMRAEYPNIPVAIFPTEKDKTDGELAVDAAFERGATALVLAGAFGGQRTDHAFLHLASAIRLAEAGVHVVLTSGAQEAHPLLPGETRFDYEDGTLFSVLGFSALSGLTLTGTKWPLIDADIPFGSSHTLSNEVEGELTVCVRKGRALLLAHPFPSLDI
jgi:thiamine pyrophosphokinase